MTDRRRNSVILLLVAILIGLATATIIAKKTRLGLDLKGGVQLVYEGRPTGAGEGRLRIAEPRDRHHAQAGRPLGVASPEIQRSGEKEIVVQLPEVTNIEKAERQVGKTAQLQFYDWEPNVIGPEGTPAPTESVRHRRARSRRLDLRADRVQGRPARPETPGRTAPQRHDLGLAYQLHPGAGERLPLRQLVPDRRKERTDAVPARAARRNAGDLRPRRKRKGGPGNRKTADQQGQAAQGRKAQGRSRQPRHDPDPGAPDRIRRRAKSLNRSPNSFFVLKDDPVLTGADVTNPQQGFDEGAGGNGQPNVNFGFTGHGKTVFEQVTKEIAHRGQEAQLPGVPKAHAEQHFAVGLDGQLITTPSIDYTQVPRRDRLDQRL